MKKITFYIILLSIILFACNETTIYDKQTYTDFPVKKELKGKDICLNDSIYFIFPQLLVKDSLCCICDFAAKEGYYCHIFTFPSLTYKYPLVKIGRGANELINPSNIKLHSGYLYIPDNINHRILRYDIKNPHTPPLKVYTLKDCIFDFAIINDTCYAAIPYTNNHNYRVKIYNQTGKALDSLLTIPKLKKALPTDFTAGEVWTSTLQYDSINNTLILATRNGEILESVHLADKTHHFAVGPGKKPELDYKGKNIVIPSKILGFKDVLIQDKYIYTLFSGTSQRDFIWNNADENYKIQVYNHDGTPVIQYSFDRPVTSFHIDIKHKKIYATDKTSEWMLSIFEL